MALDVSFSRRYENIIKISKSLTSQGKELATAKAEAQQIEQGFLQAASTAEEYQSQCDDYTVAHDPEPVVSRQHAGVTANEDEAIVEEIFNTDGPTMKSYKWCTFHGDGISSTVYKARRIHDDSSDSNHCEQVVALKVMRPDTLQSPHEPRKELRIFERLQADSEKGKTIVPLLDSFQQPGGYLVLVFPFLKQDLENLLRSGRLNNKQSGLVFEGLFSGLAWIHSHGIIHRDIKPGNVLLKSMNGPVYIIDFGISWSLDDPDSEPADQKITDVGTTCYRPPELLFGYRGYDTSLDMWAAGCVIAEILRKDHYALFDAGPAGTELGLIKSIFETLGTPTDETWPGAQKYPDWGKFKFKDFPGTLWNELLPGASAAALDFMKKTVTFEAAERMTARDALGHDLGRQWAKHG